MTKMLMTEEEEGVELVVVGVGYVEVEDAGVEGGVAVDSFVFGRLHLETLILRGLPCDEIDYRSGRNYGYRCYT